VNIRLFGRGGHAAYPHLCVDPVLMQAETIVALQTLVSRHLDPTHSGVLTIAQVHAGTTHNVIPDEAFLQGSVRTLNEDDRVLMERMIRETVASVTAVHGGSFECRYERGYDPTINAGKASDHVRNVAETLLGKDRYLELAKPTMGAEDFSKYIMKSTGCIAWLGTASDERTSFGLHHPRFDIDEKAMVSGAALLAGLVCMQ
jgi:amidohydrolase